MTKSSAIPWLRPTTRVERALQDAQEIARQEGFDLPHAGHLLQALVQEPNSFSALLLGRLGVSSPELLAEVVRIEGARQSHETAAPPEKAVRPRPGVPRRRRIETSPTELAWAENRAQMLDAGRSEAQALGDTYVGTEHLLLALIEGNGITGEALRSLGVTGEHARAALAEMKAPDRPEDPKE